MCKPHLESVRRTVSIEKSNIYLSYQKSTLLTLSVSEDYLERKNRYTDYRHYTAFQHHSGENNIAGLRFSILLLQSPKHLPKHDTIFHSHVEAEWCYVRR